MGGVIADSGQFVAVSDSHPRVAWTSAKGESWESVRVPNPAPTGCDFPEETECFPNSAGMGQLVRLGDTMYSIGTTASFNDYLRPVGWRLTDGQDWAVIESDSDFYGFGRMLDLAASDSALVAIKLTGLGGISEVWRWTFDASWIQSDLVDSEDAPLQVHDITWGQETFLAVGATLEPIADVSSDEWPATVAIWLSSDGLTWTAAPAPDAATSLCSVTATREGFVALGLTESGPAAWISSDAASWSQTDLTIPKGANTEPSMYSPSCGVVELDDGLLATRHLGQGTATWTSVDGTTWEAGPVLDVDSGADLVAAAGDTVVLFGRPPGPLPADGVARSILLIGTVEP